jgi:hypothetical protein
MPIAQGVSPPSVREHARLADLLKSKQAQVIHDVGLASTTETVGCVDTPST